MKKKMDFPLPPSLPPSLLLSLFPHRSFPPLNQWCIKTGQGTHYEKVSHSWNITELLISRSKERTTRTSSVDSFPPSSTSTPQIQAVPEAGRGRVEGRRGL
ncbi:hypothetical protein E2320_018153, partial [Naja naja]